jgi:hypothetical protein
VGVAINHKYKVAELLAEYHPEIGFLDNASIGGNGKELFQVFNNNSIP